jgi:hypothetical protein
MEFLQSGVWHLAPGGAMNNEVTSILSAIEQVDPRAGKK